MQDSQIFFSLMTRARVLQQPKSTAIRPAAIKRRAGAASLVGNRTGFKVLIFAMEILLLAKTTR